MFNASSSAPLPLAAVFSVEGTVLNDAEKSLLSAAKPFGVILFGRNCETPLQVKKLCDDIRAMVGWNCPILIDQEGGRVCRMKSPAWDQHKAAGQYGAALDKNFDEGALSLGREMTDLAKMLLKSGVDVNCAPVLDVRCDGASDIIGDRAYSSDPVMVANAGDIVCQAFLDAGVTPVIKHVPGHGRALVDSHLELPVVDATLDDLMNTDFFPFQSIAQKPYAESVWGMVAHIVYPSIDPSNLPATLSPMIIRDIIRGKIGFNGLLFSDDLDMKALEKYGSIANRAKLTLEAGCDIALYCWAKMDVMQEMAAQLPPLSAAAWQRWQNGLTAEWAA